MSPSDMLSTQHASGLRVLQKSLTLAQGFERFIRVTTNKCLTGFDITTIGAHDKVVSTLIFKNNLKPKEGVLWFLGIFGDVGGGGV
jgi:hypothetical protein